MFADFELNNSGRLAFPIHDLLSEGLNSFPPGRRSFSLRKVYGLVKMKESTMEVWNARVESEKRRVLEEGLRPVER